MKKTNLLLLFCMLVGLVVKSQSISDVMGYYDAQHGKLHYVALLSDNSIWRYSEGEGWKAMAKKGLPESAPKQVDMYIKAGFSKTDIRPTCLLADNSVWRYNEDISTWEKISNGVPSGSTVKNLKPFMTYHSSKWETKYVAQLSDNTLGSFTMDDKWETITQKGLKPGEMRYLGAYGKFNQMGGGVENFLALVDGKSMWSCKNGSKWEAVSTNGLPSGFSINQFDAILKLALFSMTSASPEPELFISLDDQTMWTYIPGNRSWYDIDSKGFPANYKIKRLRAYQKYGNATPDVRILACLDDNSLWYCTEKDGWTQISTTGLPLTK